MALSIEQCQDLVLEFCSIYPVAAQVAYKIRNTQEELYGPENTKDKVGTILGGFHPEQRQADFAASAFRDTDEFKETIRHEILGHFGINTFTADEKAGVLRAIVEARDQPVLRGLWRKIDTLYWNQPEHIRAEEVFAFTCEAIRPDRPVDPIEAEKSYREVCVERTRPMTKRDLGNITVMVAQGMRDRTREPQEHPWDDYEMRRGDNMENEKKPFHETVAEKLVEQLKQGTAPWQKPWEPGEAGANMPINPTTGKRYKGINALQLMSEGREDQRWMTYKQAAAVDAQVRKGEKGTPIQYWKFSEDQNKTDATGKPIHDGKGEPVKETVQLERPRVFFATVFNAEQIDGLPPQQPRQAHAWSAVERAEQILEASAANIRHGGDKAFYRVSDDSIQLPEKSQFPTANNYYATALHELGHWTGHQTRLDRDLVHPFGSEGYAKEELRAEIASMIVGDELGIGHDPEQHAAYVGSWIKALQDDPLEIFRAAADAEQIQKYVLGLEQTQKQTATVIVSTTINMAEVVQLLDQQMALVQGEAWSILAEVKNSVGNGDVVVDVRHPEFGKRDEYGDEDYGAILHSRALMELSRTLNELEDKGIFVQHDHRDNNDPLASRLPKVALAIADKIEIRNSINEQLGPHGVRVDFDVSQPQDTLSIYTQDGAQVTASGMPGDAPQKFSWDISAAKIAMWLDQHRQSPNDVQAEVTGPEQNQREVERVANFVAVNHNLLLDKIAENTRHADPELKAILGDEIKMSRIGVHIEELLQGTNPVYINETLAVIATTLHQIDAPDKMKVAAEARAELDQLIVESRIDPDQDRRDAQKVAAFIAANHNLFAAKIAENIRFADPDLKALLSDDARMAELEDRVNDTLQGLNPVFIKEVRDVIALTLVNEQTNNVGRQQSVDQQSQILAELGRLHINTEIGCNPLESWENLRSEAERNGLKAEISRGGGKWYDNAYAVTYVDKNGQDTGISTKLYSDGKALTSVGEKRVPGTVATSDLHSQNEALTAAVDHVQKQAFTRENDMLSSTQRSTPATAQNVDPLAKIDIADVLNAPDTSYSHFEAFQGESLDQALRSHQLNTVRDVTGHDPARFLETALANLSPVFGIEVDHDGVNNAYLERKGLAQSFAIKAEQMLTPIQMIPTVDRAEAWTLGRIENGTLARALDIASQTQIERVVAVLDTMEPIAADNPFWQRNELPQDVAALADKIDSAKELATVRQADAIVAAARIDLVTGQAFGRQRAGDAEAFDRDAEENLGFTIPHDWTGRVQVHNIEHDIDGEMVVLLAANRGEKSEFWGVYAQLPNGFHEHLANLPTEQQADELAERLAVIDARSTVNEHEKAAKLARVNEERVRRNPDSTDEDIAAAKDARKNAEFTATINDADLQRRIEFEERQRTVAQAVDGRAYLAVPYAERTAAKAAGAEWDKAAKSWYAGPKADLAKCDKWKPENVPAQQGPAMTPREEFADALRSIGCVVPAGSDHPIMDGTKQRISVKGEKFSEKSGSGFYVGHMDGHPAGYMKNNKTGTDLTWKAKGYTLDPEQKALLAAEAAEKLQQREAALSKQQEQAAKRVGKELGKLVPVTTATPYMQAKGIEPHAGALTDKDGQKTYVPATDVNGKQWTTQYIKEDGTKRFAKDSKKEGCFHVVGGTVGSLDELAKAPAIVIGEGYATAASLKQSLGFPTVSAFDSGNLAAVAQALHQKFPDKPIIIAGDDDRHLDMTQGTNPGRSKAMTAANLVGGKLMMPIFAPGENSYPAGLDPVTPDLYREHERTKKALSEEQMGALAQMKQFTDFNDLANKSVLGAEGIDRQVRSLVESVIEKHQAALSQSEQQQQEQDRGATVEPEKVQKAEAPKKRRFAKVA